MEDELINLKLTSRQLISAQKKCLKNEKKQLSDVKKAIKQGNRAGAAIYAQNAIREKNQAMTYLQLSSRVDAVASRLETGIRTNQVSLSLGEKNCYAGYPNVIDNPFLQPIIRSVSLTHSPFVIRVNRFRLR